MNLRIQPQQLTDFFSHRTSATAPLSQMQRAALVTLDLLGIEHSTICALTGCKAETVDRWVGSFETTGTVDDIARSGRPRITTRSQDEKIVGYAREHHFTAPHVINNELKLGVSDKLVRRRLDEMRLHGRVSRSTWPLTQKHRDDRVAFAQAHLHWTVDDWKKVVFADETYVGLGDNGQLWVQRPPGTAYDKEYMKFHKHNFAEKIGFYSFFSHHGVGPVHLYPYTMKDYRYRMALDQVLLPELNKPIMNDIKFYLQDNAPYHTSSFAKAWFTNKPVELVKFPARSPDLNPIENLWHELKQSIEAQQPTTIQEIIEGVHMEWPKISTESCMNKIESMHERMQAVIAAEGHMTRY